MSNDQETVEEAPIELTAAQKKAHELNEVRRQVYECCYEREVVVMVLSQNPLLVKALKEFAAKVHEAVEIHSQRYELRY